MSLAGTNVFDGNPTIAILGPSSPPNTDDATSTLASSLAGSGYTILVSGSGHTVNTAARAAMAHDGAVCLVTDNEASTQSEELNGCSVIVRTTALQCFEVMLEHADAIVVLPGDLTALAALLQVWAFGTTKNGPYRPVILLGEGWPKIVEILADTARLDQRHRAMLTFARAPDEAVESLRYYVAP